MSGQIGTSAELSRGHFGTGTELSRPPVNIFAAVGRTKEILLVIIIIEDHWFYGYTQEYTPSTSHCTHVR